MIAVGEIYTLGPFVMHDGRPHPGGICVRVVDRLLSDRGRCIAQHVTPVKGGWAPGMSAAVPVDALTPIPGPPVQLELFELAGGAHA